MGDNLVLVEDDLCCHSIGALARRVNGGFDGGACFNAFKWRSKAVRSCHDDNSSGCPSCVTTVGLPSPGCLTEDDDNLWFRSGGVLVCRFNGLGGVGGFFALLSLPMA